MPTTAKSNAKSTTRRKPIQSAQERPAAQVVQFPLFSPKPRQTAPQEVQVVVCECSADAVRVRLLPDPAAVWCMMDETFGTLGWTRRYYFADGRLWCGVGVYHPLMNNFAIKDAAAPAGKLQISNPDKWKENGSFLAAAALWGAGADVMELPSLIFAADQVAIDPVHKRAKNPNDPPTVVGYFLLLLFGAKRPVGIFFMEQFGVKLVMNWYSAIFASIVVAFPLMYRTARGAFESFDETLAWSAQTLGQSDTWIFWRVRMPACRQGILAGTVLAFARALGEYGATSMIAGYTPGKTATIATTVYQLWRTNDEAGAMRWVLVDIAISAVVLLAVNLLEKKQKAGGRK